MKTTKQYWISLVCLFTTATSAKWDFSKAFPCPDDKKEYLKKDFGLVMLRGEASSDQLKLYNTNAVVKDHYDLLFPPSDDYRERVGTVFDRIKLIDKIEDMEVKAYCGEDHLELVNEDKPLEWDNKGPQRPWYDKTWRTKDKDGNIVLTPALREEITVNPNRRTKPCEDAAQLAAYTHQTTIKKIVNGVQKEIHNVHIVFCDRYFKGYSGRAGLTLDERELGEINEEGLSFIKEEFQSIDKITPRGEYLFEQLVIAAGGPLTDDTAKRLEINNKGWAENEIMQAGRRFEDCVEFKREWPEYALLNAPSYVLLSKMLVIQPTAVIIASQERKNGEVWNVLTRRYLSKQTYIPTIWLQGVVSRETLRGPGRPPKPKVMRQTDERPDPPAGYERRTSRSSRETYYVPREEYGRNRRVQYSRTWTVLEVLSSRRSFGGRTY